MMTAVNSDATPARHIADQKRAEEYNLLRTLMDSLPDYVYVKDGKGRFVLVNAAILQGMGASRPEEVIGKTDFDLFPPQLAEQYYATDQRVFETGQPSLNHEEPDMHSGRWNLTTAVPVRDASGTITSVIGISRDITEHKLAVEELKRHRDHLEELVTERTAELEKLNQELRQQIAEGKRREEIIQRQAQEILDISTPVLQVWEGVVVAPLIGTLDSQRTQRFMEVLLERIVATRSAMALVDITGVPTIDTQTAYHLIETISAVRLLGAQVVLTGVSPQIAQTLVHLGIDLSGIATHSSLVAGLRSTLDMLGIQMISKGKTHRETKR
jgi:PAS domain S-box-containing protein